LPVRMEEPLRPCASLRTWFAQIVSAKIDIGSLTLYLSGRICTEESSTRSPGFISGFYMSISTEVYPRCINPNVNAILFGEYYMFMSLECTSG
jgi:hypothetical protein